MPTYEYKCFACDHTFEKFQSIMAAPIRKCPACGKAKAKRLLGTGAGLIFKGSGFYITDYRSESYKSDQKGDAPATTTESKPDAKADSKKETKSPSTDAAPAKSESKPEAKPEPKQASKSAAKGTRRSK